MSESGQVFLRSAPAQPREFIPIAKRVRYLFPYGISKGFREDFLTATRRFGLMSAASICSAVSDFSVGSHGVVSAER
jgi:hypothetical protein